MKKLTYLILVAMTGCTTSPRYNYFAVVHEKTPPDLAPWSSGQTVTYWLGRTTVGQDGDVMHEAHPVYRREDAGQPQMAVPPAAWTPAAIPPATTNTVLEQADALRAETARTRDVASQVVRAGEDLAQQLKPLKALIVSNQLLQEQVRDLHQTTSDLTNRISRLEGQPILAPEVGGSKNRDQNRIPTNVPVKARP